MWDNRYFLERLNQFLAADPLEAKEVFPTESSWRSDRILTYSAGGSTKDAIMISSDIVSNKEEESSKINTFISLRFSQPA